MKRIGCFLLAAVLLLCAHIYCFAEAYGDPENTKKAVGRVYAEYSYQVFDIEGNKVNSGTGFWTGSAFAVGKLGQPVKYFVTNRHCVTPEDSVYFDSSGNLCLEEGKLDALYLIFDNEPTLHRVDVVSDNEGGADLAVIKLRDPTDQREAAVLRPYVYDTEDERRVFNNSPVYSVGFPGSQDAVLDKERGLASGIDMVSTRKGIFDHGVDALHTDGKGELIQTDVPISSGNSGGPMVDENGYVIGVCTYGATSDENMNFAVSVNEVVKLLDRENIPYTTVEDIDPAPDPDPSSPTPSESSATPDLSGSSKPHSSWYIYAIFGAAIIGVIALLIVLLRRPKPISERSGPLSHPKPPEPTAKRVLIGVEGPLKDQRFTLEKGGKLRIGRGQSCNVRFKDGTPGVSRIHCEIRFDGKTATITDLKSSYGTYVDRKKLDPNVTVTLHRSLAIDIGTEKNRFVLQ